MTDKNTMKYIMLTNETKVHNGVTLYRIQALKDFSDVKAGDKGGWIEKESNLSQYDNAWIYDNARVYGEAMVYDNARVYGEAMVYGNARVYGEARIYGYVEVYGYAWIHDNARIYGHAEIYDNAKIYGHAKVYSHTQVSGSAEVYGYAWIHDKFMATQRSMIMQQQLNQSAKNGTLTIKNEEKQNE